MKTKNRREALLLPGQITFWDIEITEKPKKVIEKFVSFTKTEEKSSKTGDLFTEVQNKVVEKYKTFPELNRIIHYCGGGVGIELAYEDFYKTIYINTAGKEEFTWNKKLPVLPMDKIVYYKSPNNMANNTQEEKLKEVLQKTPYSKVIRRKADENIIVELPGKVISINAIGWVLEFQGCKTIYCEDEVEKQELAIELNIKDLQKSVKLGDIIEAQHGQRLIQGEIVHVYGPGIVTLNVVFDNGTRHTAIHRSRITKLIKCA